MKTATAIATKSSGKNFFFKRFIIKFFVVVVVFFPIWRAVVVVVVVVVIICLSCVYRFDLSFQYFFDVRSDRFMPTFKSIWCFFCVCILNPFFTVCVCMCATNRKIYNSEKWLYWISIFFSLCVCVCNDPKKQKWLSYLCLSQSYY